MTDPVFVRFRLPVSQTVRQATHEMRWSANVRYYRMLKMEEMVLGGPPRSWGHAMDNRQYAAEEPFQAIEAELQERGYLDEANDPAAGLAWLEGRPPGLPVGKKRRREMQRYTDLTRAQVQRLWESLGGVWDLGALKPLPLAEGPPEDAPPATTWRSATVYECPPCSARTNRWLMRAGGPAVVCPGSLYEEHVWLEGLRAGEVGVEVIRMRRWFQDQVSDVSRVSMRAPVVVVPLGKAVRPYRKIGLEVATKC